MQKDTVYLLLAALVLGSLFLYLINLASQAYSKYSQYDDIVTANEIILARKFVQAAERQSEKISQLTQYCFKDPNISKNLDSLTYCKKDSFKSLGLPRDFEETYRTSLLPLPQSIVYTPSKDIVGK